MKITFEGAQSEFLKPFLDLFGVSAETTEKETEKAPKTEAEEGAPKTEEEKEDPDSGDPKTKGSKEALIVHNGDLRIAFDREVFILPSSVVEWIRFGSTLQYLFDQKEDISHEFPNNLLVIARKSTGDVIFRIPMDGKCGFYEIRIPRRDFQGLGQESAFQAGVYRNAVIAWEKGIVNQPIG